MWDHCWNAMRTNQNSLQQITWLGPRSGCSWVGQGIIDGGGSGGWLGAWIGCGRRVGGLGAVEWQQERSNCVGKEGVLGEYNCWQQPCHH
jgi:hypothetical protein